MFFQETYTNLHARTETEKLGKLLYPPWRRPVFVLNKINDEGKLWVFQCGPSLGFGGILSETRAKDSSLLSDMRCQCTHEHRALSSV